jgi:hypothetical protein
MLSTARQAANAANARLSTGPRTAEGKAHASQNARKHGLTARDLVLREGEQEEFDDLLASYQAELDPQGPLEQDLFDQLLHAAWNLRRVRRLEAELAPDSPDPLLEDSLERTLQRLARYHSRAERTYFRALKELRALQTNRALLHQHRELPAPPPKLAALTELTKRTHREPYLDLMDHYLRSLEQAPAPGCP